MLRSSLIANISLVAVVVSFSARASDKEGGPKGLDPLSLEKARGGFSSIVEKIKAENAQKISSSKARNASPGSPRRKKPSTPNRTVSSSPSRIDVRNRLGSGTRLGSPTKRPGCASPTRAGRSSPTKSRPASARTKPSSGIGAPVNKLSGSLTSPFGKGAKGLSPDIKGKMLRREGKAMPSPKPFRKPAVPMRLARTANGRIQGNWQGRRAQSAPPRTPTKATGFVARMAAASKRDLSRSTTKATGLVARMAAQQKQTASSSPVKGSGYRPSPHKPNSGSSPMRSTVAANGQRLNGSLRSSTSPQRHLKPKTKIGFDRIGSPAKSRSQSPGKGKKSLQDEAEWKR